MSEKNVYYVGYFGQHSDRYFIIICAFTAVFLNDSILDWKRLLCTHEIKTIHQ